jgi:hypothetical protein
MRARCQLCGWSGEVSNAWESLKRHELESPDCTSHTNTRYCLLCEKNTTHHKKKCEECNNIIGSEEEKLQTGGRE